MNLYLGVDIGSVTAKLALVDDAGRFFDSIYLRTQGKPIWAIQEGLKRLRAKLPRNGKISGVGATGSGRYLAAAIVGGDVIKNEITSQVIATSRFVPQVRTIIEIGGQDSKIILLRNGVVADFGMNTVCAAGTGSFLDHQAMRLNIPIEDFGERAVRSRSPVRIGGKCTVFAESDMIQKQQMGHRIEDIIYGLCQALARNYLGNVGLGRELQAPIAFQGGVAFNLGMVRAFKEALETEEVIVPPHHEAMGAIGAALLVLEEMRGKLGKTLFRGFAVCDAEYTTRPFECRACPNLCEMAEISLASQVIARCGGRCDMWEQKPAPRSVAV
ncbi:MAG: acyl-CoA dehydratase activase [Dehalococcoidia bacterium]|nr:acyl-CoA dehydratase activase [Dehalococcoidia bacterium]